MCDFAYTMYVCVLHEWLTYVQKYMHTHMHANIAHTIWLCPRKDIGIMPSLSTKPGIKNKNKIIKSETSKPKIKPKKKEKSDNSKI